MDGHSGQENIATMWKGHYETIFNSVSNDACKEEVMIRLTSVNFDDHNYVCDS